MNAELESKAEVAKLARLLETEPASLQFLEKVPPDELRVLRDQATDLLFDADQGALLRMASASRVIPVPVLAKIAVSGFGPLLCARITGLIDPPRAVEIAARLDPGFLADVAASLDPRRATDVIANMPVEQIVAVSTELLARDEYVTMGRFIGHLSDPALRAAVDVCDEASLLRIAFVLEGKERLPDVLELLSGDRLRTLIEVGASGGMWPEVLDLLSNVDDAGRQAGRAGERAAEALQLLAGVAASLDVALLRGAALAATEHGLWPALIKLCGLMDAPAQQRVAGTIASAPDEIVEAMFAAVAAERLWPQLLWLAAPLDPAEIDRLASRGAEQIDLGALLAAAEHDGHLWEPGLRLLAGLDAGLQATLLARATPLAASQREELAERARRLGLEAQLEPFARVAG